MMEWETLETYIFQVDLSVRRGSYAVLFYGRGAATSLLKDVAGHQALGIIWGRTRSASDVAQSGYGSATATCENVTIASKLETHTINN